MNTSAHYDCRCRNVTAINQLKLYHNTTELNCFLLCHRKCTREWLYTYISHNHLQPQSARASAVNCLVHCHCRLVTSLLSHLVLSRSFVSVSAMSVPIKKTTPYGAESDAPVHRIRITLTSRKVKELEKGQQQALLTHSIQLAGYMLLLRPLFVPPPSSTTRCWCTIAVSGPSAVRAFRCNVDLLITHSLNHSASSALSSISQCATI